MFLILVNFPFENRLLLPYSIFKAEHYSTLLRSTKRTFILTMLIIPGLSALCLSICIIGYNTNDDWSIGFYINIYNDCGALTQHRNVLLFVCFFRKSASTVIMFIVICFPKLLAGLSYTCLYTELKGFKVGVLFIP